MHLMKFPGLLLKWVAVIFAGVLLAGCQGAAPKPAPKFKFDPLTGAPESPAAVASSTATNTDALAAMSNTMQSDTNAGSLLPVASVSPSSGLPVAMPEATVPAAGPTSGLIIRMGDGLTVSFQDLVTPIPGVDTVVKEDGTITLIYNKQFLAAGKTRGQLEKEIHDVYVPAYFKYMTPEVSIKDRFFSVGGEVRSPGRQVYTGRMTVLGAITLAGGLTDFANPKKVTITRVDGGQEQENAKAALQKPGLDKEIFPGDSVFVPKKYW
jgi:protein involved in polysaccharide export with SLBB domain